MITGEDLPSAFVTWFPDQASAVAANEEEWRIDGKVAAYLFLGEHLEPILMSELKDIETTPGTENFTRAMAFLEELLVHGDEYVSGAAATGTCEQIALDLPGIWGRARPFVGPETLRICRELRADWQPGDWRPSEG
jgi:hypothetical protein